MGIAPHEGDGTGEEGTEGCGCTRGGAGEGREKRQREGSSRRVKTKKPREDHEGGSPSAFDSMDNELNRGCLFGRHCERPARGIARRAGPGNALGPDPALSTEPAPTARALRR